MTCRALPKPLADFFAYTAKKEARRHLACAAPRVAQSLSNRTHDHVVWCAVVWCATLPKLNQIQNNYSKAFIVRGPSLQVQSSTLRVRSVTLVV